MDLDWLEQGHPGFGCFEIDSGRSVPIDLDRSLARFFSAAPMETEAITLGNSRGETFSLLMGLRAERGLALHVRRGNEIKGVAALSVRPGYINGERRVVGYIGDLRIEFERELVRDWRCIYGDVLQVMESWPGEEGLAGCLTYVIRSNERALRALVEPHRSAPYRYMPLANCHMINVLAKVPLGRFHPSRLAKKLRAGGLSIREARASDLDAVIDFLDQQQTARPFGYCFDDELPRRLRAWPGFGFERFFIVEDRRGRIRAVAAPWSPGDAKRTMVERLTPSLVWAERLVAQLPTTRYFRWPHLPRVGEALEILYLTHLEFDLSASAAEREAALGLLVSEAIDRHADEPWNFLSFADFDSQSLRKGLGGFFWQAIPMSLFSVHRLEGDASAGEHNRRISRPLSIAPDSPPPAFEMCII